MVVEVGRNPSPTPFQGEGESLTIQEVAERTGLTAHTLRYYERAGLLSPVTRNEGGHRRYTSADVGFLVFLTRLRSTGMPIHSVRRYAELVREGDSTLDERRRILEGHRNAVRVHIGELEENLRVLDLKIASYECGYAGPVADVRGLEP